MFTLFPLSSHHPSLCSSGSETMRHRSQSHTEAWFWHLPMASAPAKTSRWTPASPGCHSHLSASLAYPLAGTVCSSLCPAHPIGLPSYSCPSNTPALSPSLAPSPSASQLLSQTSPLSIFPSSFQSTAHPPLQFQPSSHSCCYFSVQTLFWSLSVSAFLSLFLSPFYLYSYSCPHPHPYHWVHLYPCPCPSSQSHSGLFHSCPGSAPQTFRLEIEVMDRHGHNCSGVVRVEVLPSSRSRVTFP